MDFRKKIHIFVKKQRNMSKKSFKRIMKGARVIAVPTRKRDEVQLYDIIPMKMLNNYD